MNLLYRSASSKNGSEMQLAKEIKERSLFKKIFVLEYGELDDSVEEGIECISIGLFERGAFDSLPEWRKATEVDDELLTKMLPFKDTCIHMFSLRPYDLYVGTYDELDNIYNKNVRFWNYYLKEKKIDVVYFSVIPHHGWEYTMYAVAKCLNIPTLLLMESHIPGLCAVGTSIETIGTSTAKWCREKMHSDNHTNIKPIVDDYYLKASGKQSQYSYAEKIRLRKRQVFKFHGHRYFWHPAKAIVKKVFRGDRTVCNDLPHFFDAQRAQHRACGIRTYEKMSISEIEGRYVYFPLQLTPEATTLPWAGIFANQMISVRLLSSALGQMNIKLVVKEHYVQARRPKNFYRELHSLPNVFCADWKSDAYDWIEGAMACVTQTGSCITESILKCKPVLTFAEGYWSGCDNVWLVKKEEDIIAAIRDIESNRRTYTQENSDRYFAAIEHTFIQQNLDYYGNELVTLENYLKDKTDLIEAFCKSGLSESFCYYREK